jgi:photosystem II protein
MAFALTTNSQRVSTVVKDATSLRRTAFTGSRSAFLPLIGNRQCVRQTTPQALFTRNKEDKGRKTGYDKNAFEVDPVQPAFTRRRELFVGRLAMLGFASALLGEIATGLGPLGQLQLELGLPSYAVDLLVLGIVGYSFVGGLNPKSPTFSAENQRDVKKRGAGPTQKPQINAVGNPGKFFGATEYGFSKKNELLVGRTAQLGFLAAVIGEKVTGFGPLKQFGLETGIPLGQASVLLIAFISFFLLAAVFNGEYGDKAIDEDRTY